jgi:FixJ family two-component response regulator
MKPKPKILLVDDETHVVDGLAQVLRREYDVRTATNPQDALRGLSEINGLAVVVSDFRMPGMDGATFLHEVMVRRPDVARILLTGEAGRDGAVRAINEGQILRFLSKPCPADEVKKAIEAGVIQHRLIQAERSVLQETLIGCIKVLMEVLAIANPVAFGRAERIQKLAARVAERFNCADFWQLDAAALLSQLGYITVPQDVLEKVYRVEPLSASEQQKVNAVPDVSNALLEHIPRLEPVIQVLAALKWNDAQIAKLGDGTIGLGTRILGAVIEHESLAAAGKSRDEIRVEMHKKVGRFGEKLLMQLDDCAAQNPLPSVPTATNEREVLLRDAVPGSRLLCELRTEDGALLVPMNFEVTRTLLERLANIHPKLLALPVRVKLPA